MVRPHVKKILDVLFPVYADSLHLAVFQTPSFPGLRLRAQRCVFTHASGRLQQMLSDYTMQLHAVLLTCPRVQGKKPFSVLIVGLSWYRTRATCVARSFANHSAINYNFFRPRVPKLDRNIPNGHEADLARFRLKCRKGPQSAHGTKSRPKFMMVCTFLKN